MTPRAAGSTMILYRFTTCALLVLVMHLPVLGETLTETAGVRESAKAAHQRGVSLFQKKDLAGAESSFRMAVQSAPTNMLYHKDLAQVLLEMGRVSESLNHFGYIALKLAPENAIARHQYAVALGRAQRTAEAGRQLQEVLRLDPSRLGARRDLVRVLVAQENLMLASQVAVEGVELHPDDATIRNDQGVVLMRLGEQDEAIKAFQRALQLDANLEDTHFNMGIVYTERWDLKKAIHHLRRAIDIEPRYADARYHYADALARLGDLDAATREFDALVEIFPTHALAHQGLGLIALKKDQPKEAIKGFTESLRHDPGLVESQLHLGIALISLKRHAQAVAPLRAAVRGLPKNPEARYHHGLALASAGESESALASLREALWLRPGWSEAEEAIRRLESQAASLNIE